MGTVYTLPYGSRTFSNSALAFTKSSKTYGVLTTTVNEGGYFVGYGNATYANPPVSALLFWLPRGGQIYTVADNGDFNGPFVTADYLGIGTGCSIEENPGDWVTQYRTDWEWLIDVYDTKSDAIAALKGRVETGDPITYRLTNCTAPNAPEGARSGNTVTVTLVPDTGFAFINDSDILVTNNGITVQSTFSNGVLTFTMP